MALSFRTKGLCLHIAIAAGLAAGCGSNGASIGPIGAPDGSSGGSVGTGGIGPSTGGLGGANGGVSNGGVSNGGIGANGGSFQGGAGGMTATGGLGGTGGAVGSGGESPDSGAGGSNPDASAGGTATGGTNTGGASTGGTSTGGTSTGGTSTGGTSTGGTSTGGASTGGTSTGGASTGGTSTGGASTGGASTGGASTGGASTGGTSTGGASTGGASTGGTSTGGTSTGGASTGGTSTGGTSTGGTSTGGASTGGSSTGGNGTGGSGTSSGPPCITKGSQIVLIGDSYFTGAFGSPELQRDGIVPMLATANTWRNYAVLGISMATGGLFNTANPPAFVPLEFDNTTKASLDVLGPAGDAPPTTSPITTGAVQDDPDIKLSIMDGGGNDILLQDATTTSKDVTSGTTCINETNNSADPECQLIVQEAIDAATTLMNHAADSGVKDVIYFFYPHLPGGGLGGSNPNELLDYAEPKAKALCDSAATNTSGKLTCHFIDLVAPFKAAGGDGNPANFSAVDSVHPSQAGQNIIATQILNTMKNDCLGQPASSGCCTP